MWECPICKKQIGVAEFMTPLSLFDYATPIVKVNRDTNEIYPDFIHRTHSEKEIKKWVFKSTLDMKTIYLFPSDYISYRFLLSNKISFKKIDAIYSYKDIEKVFGHKNSYMKPIFSKEGFFLPKHSEYIFDIYGRKLHNYDRMKIKMAIPEELIETPFLFHKLDWSGFEKFYDEDIPYRNLNYEDFMEDYEEIIQREYRMEVAKIIRNALKSQIDTTMPTKPINNDSLKVTFPDAYMFWKEFFEERQELFGDSFKLP
jgi:hypothetical protein